MYVHRYICVCGRGITYVYVYTYYIYIRMCVLYSLCFVLGISSHVYVCMSVTVRTYINSQISVPMCDMWVQWYIMVKRYLCTYLASVAKPLFIWYSATYAHARLVRMYVRTYVGTFDMQPSGTA